MKILITGGHMSPALAILDELRDRKANTSDLAISFVGRMYTDHLHQDVSLEYQEVVTRDIAFTHLETGRLTRLASARSFLQLLKVGNGFIQSWQILRREKPSCVLSFGGYIALPIALVAAFLGIPVYTHEQTIHPGLANKIIARVATKVFVAFPESKSMFPRSRVIVSGNPVRKDVFADNHKKPFSQNDPVIYVTGGSLGSHSINMHIAKILPELLKQYCVIHQTGDVQEYNDFAHLQKMRSHLPARMQERYILTKHVSSDEIGTIYVQADIVVGRSGANTFFELIALKKPSVLIPLPWSSHGEQERHATILVQAGVAVVFSQSDQSQNLLSSIHTVMSRRLEIGQQFASLIHTYPHNATHIITQTILNTT